VGWLVGWGDEGGGWTLDDRGCESSNDMGEWLKDGCVGDEGRQQRGWGCQSERERRTRNGSRRMGNEGSSKMISMEGA
jgi:hypothetical protein